MRRAAAAALCCAALLASTGASAAQIVALDLQAIGGVKKNLAASLSPLLVDTLARREGMSVISQSDVRALLRLESDKQALGCDDASCMSDIAGSLGAELLAASTIGKVGRGYVVSVHLIDVATGKVLSRASARVKGGESSAAEAVETAVHELFRKPLPETAQGPASLSRRGFRAALAGLQTAALGDGGDAHASRKRVILDIVHTELDYDAKPKMEALRRAIERGRNASRLRRLGAKTAKEAAFHLRAQDYWTALSHDLGRVKEIRERARQSGLVPSARPLRFEPPEPSDRPDEKAIKRYFSTIRQAEAEVRALLAAAKRNDVHAFVSHWRTDLDDNAVTAFRRIDAAAQRGRHYRLLPHFALSLRDLERGIAALDEKPRKDTAQTAPIPVFLLETRDGKAWQEKKIMVEQQKDGAWKVVRW